MQNDHAYKNIFENGIVTPRVYLTPDGTVALEYTSAGLATFTGNLRVNNYISVGVALSAWGSSYSAVEVGGAGSALYGSAGQISLSWNAYHDGSNWKYVTSSNAQAFTVTTAGLICYGAASGTAGNNITFTSLLRVYKANSVALEGANAQAGTGITFPATQSASSDVNTLDDYEEGTWTPTDASGAGLSFTSHSCRYTKVGRLVTVTIGEIAWPVTASGANASIGGLPFAAAAASGGTWVSGFVFAWPSPGVSRVAALLAGGGTSLGLYEDNNTAYTNAQMSTWYVYGGSFSYYV